MSVFNFIILLTLIGEGGPITFKNVMEGDPIKLNFSFPCSSAKVTLRQGHKAPFYDSNPESMPVSDRHEIMLSEEDHCFLQLKLNHVLRSDEGGYILTAYDGQGNFLEDCRIGLRVDYPPGIVSCKWLEKNIMDDWGTMLCKAPAGSTSGIIACYHNGIRLPPKTTPTEAGNVLQQTIWVRYSEVALCCASLQGQENLIDTCECKDFTWDPSHSGNTMDPCVAPLQDSPTPTPSHEDMSTVTDMSLITTITEQKPADKKVYSSQYWARDVVIGILTLVIVILFVQVFRKVQQIKKREQNGPYTGVQTTKETVV